MLFNQTIRLKPYHLLNVVYYKPYGQLITSQVLHGRRQFVIVSRPVESTQRTQPYHYSNQVFIPVYDDRILITNTSLGLCQAVMTLMGWATGVPHVGE